MSRYLVAFAGLFLVALSPVSAAEWKPAKGPLTTPWTKDVTPETAHPEYPRPQLVRKEWQSLNGLWEFALAKKGEEPPLGKALGGQILVPFPVESALSGVMKAAEPNGDGLRVWYRRTFEVKKKWSGKRLLLHFGAVNWEATVWVNGKKLDAHRGGYDGFTRDITDALKKDGPQEIVVGVWNPIDSGTQPRGKQVRKPGGIFYTASTGIWQTVWLEPVCAGRIEGLTIETDIHKSEVTVRLKLSKTLGNAAMMIAVLEGHKVIAQTIGLESTYTLKIPKAKKWTPEAPHLYGLRVTAGFKVLGDWKPGDWDTVESYFGMRKISVGLDDKGVTRLLLNGMPVFQYGPLDQGFWPDGLYTAPTDAALKYDIEITKKLGFNMTRKHVKVEPDRWYYWCDKLGLLVWQDMPSGDRSIGGNDPDIKRTSESAQQYELELKRMIDGLRNHPSIIMWVVFNEGWGQFDTPRIAKLAKKLDPTRLVNSASGWTDRGVGDMHDLHSYPAPSCPKPEKRRAAVLGEYGGLGLGVEGHSWSGKTWGYQGTRDSAELTSKYERFAAAVWRLKDKPGLSAAVYTQITDVETEGNGLLTYDRKVIKVDVERVKAVNTGDLSRVPKIKIVVPASQEKGQLWRYTLGQAGRRLGQAGVRRRRVEAREGGIRHQGDPGRHCPDRMEHGRHLDAT